VKKEISGRMFADKLSRVQTKVALCSAAHKPTMFWACDCNAISSCAKTPRGVTNPNKLPTHKIELIVFVTTIKTVLQFIEILKLVRHVIPCLVGEEKHKTANDCGCQSEFGSAKHICLQKRCQTTKPQQLVPTFVILKNAIAVSQLNDAE